MRRLGLLVLALLIIPQAGVAQQSTREFLRAQGEGEMVPIARITFHQTAEGQLCTILGIARGPQAIPKNSFKFERITRRDGDGDTGSEKLAFKFPKKPKEKDEGFTLWENCVPSEPRQGEEGEDQIEVQVRRPRTKPVELSIYYPPVDVPFVMDISSTSDGQLVADSSAVGQDDG